LTKGLTWTVQSYSPVGASVHPSVGPTCFLGHIRVHNTNIISLSSPCTALGRVWSGMPGLVLSPKNCQL